MSALISQSSSPSRSTTDTSPASLLSPSSDLSARIQSMSVGGGPRDPIQSRTTSPAVSDEHPKSSLSSDLLNKRSEEIEYLVLLRESNVDKPWSWVRDEMSKKFPNLQGSKVTSLIYRYNDRETARKRVNRKWTSEENAYSIQLRESHPNERWSWIVEKLYEKFPQMKADKVTEWNLSARYRHYKLHKSSVSGYDKQTDVDQEATVRPKKRSRKRNSSAQVVPPLTEHKSSKSSKSEVSRQVSSAPSEIGASSPGSASIREPDSDSLDDTEPGRQRQPLSGDQDDPSGQSKAPLQKRRQVNQHVSEGGHPSVSVSGQPPVGQKGDQHASVNVSKRITIASRMPGVNYKASNTEKSIVSNGGQTPVNVNGHVPVESGRQQSSVNVRKRAICAARLPGMNVNKVSNIGKPRVSASAPVSVSVHLPVNQNGHKPSSVNVRKRVTCAARIPGINYKPSRINTKDQPVKLSNASSLPVSADGHLSHSKKVGERKQFGIVENKSSSQQAVSGDYNPSASVKASVGSHSSVTVSGHQSASMDEQSSVSGVDHKSDSDSVLSESSVPSLDQNSNGGNSEASNLKTRRWSESETQQFFTALKIHLSTRKLVEWNVLIASLPPVLRRFTKTGLKWKYQYIKLKLGTDCFHQSENCPSSDVLDALKKRNNSTSLWTDDLKRMFKNAIRSHLLDSGAQRVQWSALIEESPAEIRSFTPYVLKEKYRTMKAAGVEFHNHPPSPGWKVRRKTPKTKVISGPNKSSALKSSEPVVSVSGSSRSTSPSQAPASQPHASQSNSSQPAAAKSNSSKSTLSQAVSSQSASSKSTNVQSRKSESNVSKSITSQLVVSHPVTSQLVASQLATSQPVACHSATAPPAISRQFGLKPNRPSDILASLQVTASKNSVSVRNSSETDISDHPSTSKSVEASQNEDVLWTDDLNESLLELHRLNPGKPLYWVRFQLLSKFPSIDTNNFSTADIQSQLELLGSEGRVRTSSRWTEHQKRIFTNSVRSHLLDSGDTRVNWAALIKEVPIEIRMFPKSSLQWKYQNMKTAGVEFVNRPPSPGWKVRHSVLKISAEPVVSSPAMSQSAVSPPAPARFDTSQSIMSRSLASQTAVTVDKSSDSVISKLVKSKPISSRLSRSKPTASKLTISKSATSKPSTFKQTVSTQTTSKSTACKLTTSEPTASNPTTSKPTTSKPTTSKQTASKPTAPKPTASKPTASKPTASKPTASKPTASKPTTSQSVISQSQGTSQLDT
eukprot:808847_1